MNRRLAAILAADVVGYSALMGADQEGTLADLRSLRAEVFGPAVAGYRGKVVKSMGDGWLVEFASAVDAVTCAMQMQDRLSDHQTIKLRIGIHIGDVVHEEEDVFGDGVNVAARLEALAEPGSVVISDAVHGSLDGTLRPSFDDQGEQPLKNIERAVRVWARGGAVAGDRRDDDGRAIARLEIQPVQTSDDRSEVRELADALTNDLGSFLGHLDRVRTTVTAAPAEDAWVLRPVLRTRGDRLRLEILLASPSAGQRWTKRYDGSLADSFDWQDETAVDAAGYFHGVLLDELQRKLEAKPVGELSALEAIFLAFMKTGRLDHHAAEIADLLRHAVRSAPDSADVHINAVMMYYMAVSTGYGAIHEYVKGDIAGWRGRATELADEDKVNQLSLAFFGHIASPDPEHLRRAALNALRARPFDPLVLNQVGFSMMYLGEPETAADCYRKSLRFTEPSKHGAAVVNGLGFTAVMTGRDEEALEHAKRALTIIRDMAPAFRVIAAASAHLGQMEEARAAMAKLQERYPGETIAGLKRRAGWTENRYTRRLFDGLKLAGMEEG